MKVGINLLLWTGAPSFEKDGPILDKLKNWGYDCFEICTGGLTAEDVRGFGKKADELGLEPCTLDVYVCTEMDVISPDPAMRKRAVEFLKSGIVKTAELGGKVFSGPFFQGLCNTTQVGPTADEWKRAVDSLRECAGFAKEKRRQTRGGALEPLRNVPSEHLRPGVQVLHGCGHGQFRHPRGYAPCEHRRTGYRRVLGARGGTGSTACIYPKTTAAYREAATQSRLLCSRRLKKGGYDGNLVIEAFNANVPEILPLLRLWRPFVEDVDEIAVKGLEFIKKHLQ